MAFVYSLLSWIPFVSFGSKQSDEPLPFDDIEKHEIVASPQPTPSEKVLKQMRNTAELDDAGGDVPIYCLPSDLESYIKEVQGWRLARVISELDFSVFDAKKVDRFISKRISERFEAEKFNLQSFIDYPSLGIAAVILIALIVSALFASVRPVVLGSGVFYYWINFGPVVVMLLLIWYVIRGALLGSPPLPHKKKSPLDEYSGNIDANLKSQLRKLTSLLPTAEITIEGIAGSPEKFAKVSLGDNEHYIAAWQDDEEES